MNITVYLPDELGKWAKEHDLHLSRMLREAVEIEKRRCDASTALAAETTTHELAVSEPGSSSGTDDYTARLHGVLIATQHLGGRGSINVYAGEDDKMYLHYTADGRLHRDVAPRRAPAVRGWAHLHQGYARPRRRRHHRHRPAGVTRPSQKPIAIVLECPRRRSPG